MPTKDEIIEVLKTVEDPELQLDVWFLGLIYEIDIADTKVSIDMTLTSPMCPVGPMMMGQVQECIEELDSVSEVKVNLVFDPPWEPSDEVKGLLGFL
ncbi:iron-sulfur cluster assembly protein [Oligoflexia bacterium]|nr:iron-sulfur cluster assembly protein [Oligoflexia bacterium]